MSFKRVLALVLALTMIFSLAMPGTWAFAEEDDGIVAVEDEYNEEGIVEDPVEEVPAITEETPAEEPAAEVIVPDDEPAEEPEETEEEEEELDELLLEDLDTFEAPKEGDVAQAGVMGYKTVGAAINASEVVGVGDGTIYLLANCPNENVTFSGSENWPIIFTPGNSLTDVNTIGDVTVNAGAGTKGITLIGITVGNLKVESGEVTLNNVTVSGNVEISGGTLNFNGVTVSGNVTISGGTLNFKSGTIAGNVSVESGSFIVPANAASTVSGTVTAGENAVKRTVKSGAFGKIPYDMVAFAYKYKDFHVASDTDAKGKDACTVNADGSVNYHSFADAVTAANGQKTIYLLKDVTYSVPKAATVKVDKNGYKFEATSAHAQYYVELPLDGITYTSKPYFGRSQKDTNLFFTTFAQGAAYCATNSDVLRVFENAAFNEDEYELATGTSLTVVCYKTAAATQRDSMKDLLTTGAGHFVKVSDGTESGNYIVYKFTSTPIVAKIGNTPYATLDAAVNARGTDTDLITVYGTGATHKMGVNEVLNIEKHTPDVSFTLTAPDDHYYVDPAVATKTDATTYRVKAWSAWIVGVGYYKTLSDAAVAAAGAKTVVVNNLATLDKTVGSGDYIKLTETLKKVTIDNKGNNATFDDSLVYSDVAGKAIKKTTVNATTTIYELVDAVAYINERVPAHSYLTLEEAIAAAATSTDVVYLATSTELAAGSLTIDKAITIDGNNNSITVKPNGANDTWAYGLTLAADVTLQNVEIKRDAEDNKDSYFGAILVSGPNRAVKFDHLTAKFDYADGKYNWVIVSRGGRNNVEITRSDLKGKYVVGLRDENDVLKMSNSTAAAGWAVIDSHATGASVEIDHCALSSKNYFNNSASNDYAMFAFTSGENTSVEVTNSTMVIDATGTAKQAISGGDSDKVNPVSLGEGNTVTLVGDNTIFNYGKSDLDISGGTFNKPVPDDCCADDYNPVILGNGPLYGVTKEALVLRLVDYPEDGVVQKTVGQGYLATQTELAIADAIAKQKVLVVLATDTDAPFQINLAADQKIFYATADEQYLNFVYPAGYYPVVGTDRGVSSKTATLSGAQTFDADNELVESYANTAEKLTEGFTAANETAGMSIKLWQATPTDFAYTMIPDVAKSLTVTYAAGVATLTDAIKAPAGYQLHKVGDTYTIGKAIAMIAYYKTGTSEVDRVEYFDNINDGATEAVKNSVGLGMITAPTDANDIYHLATNTRLIVVGGIDIKDNLDSGDYALIVTPGDQGTYTYTVEATVATVDGDNYPSFVSAVEVATKTNATVVLVATPDEDEDYIELTAENKGAQLTVKDDGYIATITDLLHLLPTETDTQVRTVYIDTADAGDDAKTYTLKRYAAVLTDGTGARTYYKAGELNNAIAEYYNNTSWYKYVELLDDGTYTMAKTAADLKVKANGYNFTVRGNEDTVYDIEDSTADGVTTYHVAFYAAKVFETEYKYQNTKAQGEHEWVATGETETVYAKSLSEAVATATALATRTDTAEVGAIAYDYTITLLATVTDYKLNDGATLVLDKNGFTANITAKNPESYVVKEYPVGTYISYKMYTITYRLNGGTNSDLNPAYYTTATPTVILHDPEKTGYTFEGWYWPSTMEHKVERINTANQNNKTFYAKWTPNTFTVKFDANGGLGTMTDLLLTYATDTTLTENIFTKVGNTFNGWNTAADGTGTAYADGAVGGTISEENGATVTLYAQWKPNTFTVEFNANGGTGTMSNQTFTYGTDTTLTLNMFKSATGYTGFDGWNTEADGSGTSYANGAVGGTISEENGATVTLFAQWGVAKFTLHFDGQGETSGTMENMTLTYASATSLPANTFRKDGNAFLGWTLTEGGDLWASDGSALTAANVNALFAKATGTDLTVNFYAKWQPKVAQVDETFYDTFVEAMRAARNTEKTLILWATPTNLTSDIYGVNRNEAGFKVSIKDMRTSHAANADVNGDLLVINNDTGRNDASVYFAETVPAEGVITYTLTKYAARLTDGKGTTKYYKDFDGTDETTAAVAAYLANPGYYKYIEILDAVEYAMPYDLWAADDLYLPVKVTYGSFATPTALDDSYSIDKLTRTEMNAAGIYADADDAYAVGANNVTVVFHHVKQVASQTQGQTEWVDDTSAVPVAEYTKYYDSLEKAVAAIRAARTNLTSDQKVLVTITVSADDTLVLTTPNEEYTITFENGASADVTIAQDLEPTCALTTTGEGQTFTYKAFVVNGTAVKFVNQTASGTDLAATKYVISTYNATAGTKVINPGDPMNPIDSSITKYEYNGYYFDKWYVDAGFTQAFDFENTEVGTEPITVYGRFLKATYTLTLDFNGGTAPAGWVDGNSIEYTIDSGIDVNYQGNTVKAIQLPVPINGDYVFAGWTIESTGQIIRPSYGNTEWNKFRTANARNEKLTAIWNGDTFDVDFVDPVTQTLIASQVEQEDGAVLVNVPTLTDVNAKILVKNYPEGKTLDADRLWQGVDADTVASKDVTVYNLNWLNLYEVKFHANGIDFGSAKVADGDTIPASSIPNIRMTGKTAVWHVGSEDGPVFDILNDVVTDNLDLCATFADQHKVTFNNGEVVLEKLVVDGETVAEPEQPEKDGGYEFIGWFLGDAEEAFDFATPITENITLTAKFAMTAEHFAGIKYAASAQLNESINLNLKMYGIPKDTTIDDYKLVVTVNGNETPNTFELIDSNDPYNLKAVAERAYAFQMNDTVDMKIYFTGLEEPIKVVEAYSLRKYFESRYSAKNVTNNEKAMFKAALDYGAAAQIQFNYNTDNLANATVNPQNTLPTVNNPGQKAVRTGTIDGITSYKVSLIMDSQITMKFKVNAANKDDYKFTVNAPFKAKVSDEPINGYYEIDVTGFTPMNLGERVILTITKGTELVTVEYSPYAYATSKWDATENNGALANLVKAMVIFGNAVATWNKNG